MLITRLDTAIRSVCPIDGVALLDRASGKVRIDFAPHATPQQRAAAQSLVENFDFNAPEPPDPKLADRALLQSLASKARDKWTQDDVVAAVQALASVVL
ncbi:MAG TPA: hypothetical protein VEJ63_08935 [Planctomycetota bacterium]|nr:hypothetical protein [Planctomycetota bacterium]